MFTLGNLANETMQYPMQLRKLTIRCFRSAFTTVQCHPPTHQPNTTGHYNVTQLVEYIPGINIIRFQICTPDKLIDKFLSITTRLPFSKTCMLYMIAGVNELPLNCDHSHIRSTQTYCPATPNARQISFSLHDESRRGSHRSTSNK